MAKFKVGDIVFIKKGHPDFMDRLLRITSTESFSDYDCHLVFLTPPRPNAVEKTSHIVSDFNVLTLANLSKLESLVYKINK
jgi:hypothetical protein